MAMRAKTKKEQLDNTLISVGSYERQQMQNVWNIMKTVVTDVQQKKPFLYYEDVLKVLDDFCYLNDEEKAILAQRLEQKVWIP